jgi:integrase
LLASAGRSEARNGVVTRKSKAIVKPTLEKMIKKINTNTLVGKRDRAILVFGFFTGGRRRSEIASAEMRFLTKSGGGYTYLLHRSKTDQAAKGALKLLRAPNARYLTAWLNAAGIVDGFIFRRFKRDGSVSDKRITDSTVNQIVKRYIEEIKKDPCLYSAHGLRRGFMTQCGRTGKVSLGDAMAAGGWTDVKTAMRYYEEGKLYDNPATKL